MWLELALGAALTLGVGIGAFFVKGSLVYHLSSVLMIAIVIIQILIYRPIFARIRALQSANEASTKAWLEALVNFMDRFVRLYTRAMLITTPIAAVIGGGIGYYSGTQEEPDTMMPEPIDFHNTTDQIMLLVIGTLLLVFTYFGIKWSVKWMYGKPLAQLKKALEELESDRD